MTHYITKLEDLNGVMLSPGDVILVVKSINEKNLFSAYQEQCVIAKDWERIARELGYKDP